MWKRLVGAFNQEKALVGAFSVIVETNGLMDRLIVMFVQVTLEHNSNSTNSVLKFVPDISDAGKFLKCRAENIEMTASQLEDSRNLEINCKTHNWIPPRRFPGPFI